MTNENRFRIVVGYDFSPQAALALDRAIWLASGFTDAEIHVAAALTGNSTNADFPRVERDNEGVDAIRARLVAVIESRLAALKPASVHSFAHAWLEDGRETILSIAADIKADLIVVGTHSRRGLVRAVLGSVSEMIVRDAHCPVMVVRETSWDRTEPAEIEPPCAGCLRARQDSDGASWWCTFHDHAPPYESPLRSHVQHDPEQSRRMAWPMY